MFTINEKEMMPMIIGDTIINPDTKVNRNISSLHRFDLL